MRSGKIILNMGGGGVVLLIELRYFTFLNTSFVIKILAIFKHLLAKHM